MKVDIIFPPVHDFAMPYLAGPLLKGYIQKSIPSIDVRCVDLNLSFFRSAIKGYDEFLDSYREKFSRGNLVEAVDAALEAHKTALHSLHIFSQAWRHDSWSLRNYKSSYNRQSFNDCIEYSQTELTPYDEIFEQFLEQASDTSVYCVSLTVQDQLLPVFRLMNLIKKRRPSCQVVLGGNLVSRIGQFMDLGKLSEICDYILVREGEIPLTSLLKYLALGETEPLDPRVIRLSSSTKVPSLSALDVMSRSLHTDISDFIFHPDFSDLDTTRYFSPIPMLPSLFSRKCYWGRCEFCTIHSAWDQSYRRRSARDIADELKRSISKNNINTFRVVDEGCPPDLLTEVSRILLQEGIDLRYEIYGILEKRFLDKDRVQQYAKSGCRQIFFGLESKDPQLIQAMGKSINRTRDVGEIFASTASNGIHNYTFTMFGFPGEDQEAQDRTIEYVIQEENIHTAVVSSFIPDMESPFANKNSNILHHSGDMSENYSEITIDGKRHAMSSLGSSRAKRAQREIYTRRHDLALTALLYDETRLALSDKFGPDFAQSYCKSPSANIGKYVEMALKSAADERIDRTLSAQGVRP